MHVICVYSWFRLTKLSVRHPLTTRAPRSMRLPEAAAIAMNKCILIVMHAMAAGHLAGAADGAKPWRWHGQRSSTAGGRGKGECLMKLTAQLPTQHLKTLNPHLDHAAFDAVYTTEHTARSPRTLTGLNAIRKLVRVSRRHIIVRVPGTLPRCLLASPSCLPSSHSMPSSSEMPPDTPALGFKSTAQHPSFGR